MNFEILPLSHKFSKAPIFFDFFFAEYTPNIFDAITQLRRNKKQPDESTIMTLLSEKLEELINIDKKQLAESRKIKVTCRM